MTSQAKWFYIDDFFVWLGCKFINCNKSGKEVKDKEAEMQVIKPESKPVPQEAKPSPPPALLPLPPPPPPALEQKPPGMKKLPP